MSHAKRYLKIYYWNDNEIILLIMNSDVMTAVYVKPDKKGVDLPCCQKSAGSNLLTKLPS